MTYYADNPLWFSLSEPPSISSNSTHQRIFQILWWSCFRTPLILSLCSLWLSLFEPQTIISSNSIRQKIFHFCAEVVSRTPLVLCLTCKTLRTTMTNNAENQTYLILSLSHRQSLVTQHPRDRMPTPWTRVRQHERFTFHGRFDRHHKHSTTGMRTWNARIEHWEVRVLTPVNGVGCPKSSYKNQVVSNLPTTHAHTNKNYICHGLTNIANHLLKVCPGTLLRCADEFDLCGILWRVHAHCRTQRPGGVLVMYYT